MIGKKETAIPISYKFEGESALQIREIREYINKNLLTDLSLAQVLKHIINRYYVENLKTKN
jgi:hypothetical protein